MEAIWKYQLRWHDRQSIEMPKGARILSVGAQGDQLCMWATVPGHGGYEERHIVVLGTGHEIPDEMHLTHLGTVIAGDYVWHVFEDREAA